MSIDYQDVIDIAEELAGRTDSEAALRAAVGRYYYGTLLMVRQTLVPRPSRRRGHEQASSMLGRRTKQSLGRAYQELYELRLDADYEPEVGDWRRKAVRAQRIHGHIVAELRGRRLLASSTN